MKNARRAVWSIFVAGLVAKLGFGEVPVQADDNAGSPAPATPPVSVIPGPPEPVDADQLATRMKKSDQDLYKQIRDQALAAFAKLHPAPSPSDDEARMTVRLAAYLFIWGDFYREGVWDAALYHARAVTGAGFSDPLLEALPVIHTVELRHFTSEQAALKLDQDEVQFAATDYPVAFKYWYAVVDAQNLVALKMRHQLNDPQTQAVLSGAVAKAANGYAELIKARVDPNLLASLAEIFFHDLQGDETSLTSAADIIDKSFANDDPSNAARDAVRGRYYIAYAWTARGTDYANAVTPEGWKLFGERLEKADAILEAAYLKHPEEGAIAREMLTVELGQGQGRDRMELWFGRAIKADPDDFQACTAKAYYLLPEWHGSDDEVWNFGVECAKTQNWSGKIPMVLVDSMVSHLWKQHPEYLTDNEKWPVLEAAFRGYLGQFPQSNYYRSIFARWAVEGAHWNVAQEQFKTLGDHWDPMVFPGSRYPEMKGLSDKNAQSATP